MPDADFYDELQVSRRASPEVIDAAYRRLARMYHPDTGASADAERMVRINRAHAVLSDTARRAEYDARSFGNARSSAGNARSSARQRRSSARRRRSSAGNARSSAGNARSSHGAADTTPPQSAAPAGTSADAGQRSFLDRVIGAARLDSSVYEEVRDGRRGGLQALAIIVAGSIAIGVAGLGSWGLSGLIPVLVFQLLGWAAYIWLLHRIGTRLLAGAGTRADWRGLARTLAFANGPRVFLVVGFVPFLGELVGAAVAIWVLLTTIIAVQAAFHFGTGRAIIVGAIGWMLQLGIFGVAGLIFAIGG